ncbi:hypothetical protein Leryth_005038 [Lithospermum erythrorhizon]|uniref:Acyltransferase n=1 Tax=Lithospermum erythrorhizon TaxID=34254 RepID=A0AAV3PII9_LITER|nr:hypothetical protein Leryth_005038 [Lithospermum erythrorhizon]
MMKVKEEETVFSPVSPGSQYLNSSALSLTVVAVMESEVPIDESLVIHHMIDVITPLNSRFSSVMVSGDDGSRKWKRVDVQYEDHFVIPNLETGKSIEYYDEYTTEYISKLAMEPLVQTRPLWEVHIMKYPTSNAAGGLIIFKLHHALGDGYTLMGLVLSGLQRVDNPVLPLRFPSSEPKSKFRGGNSARNFIKNTPRNLARLMYTLSDFGWGILKSKLMKDDETPIRSGDDGVEFRPIVVKTMAFPLDSIKQIKDKLNVTINDVITGIITMGTRLYMQGESQESSTTDCTALVLLNTRAVGGYKSVSDMLKPNTDSPWGNHFAFLHVPLTKLNTSEGSNPLDFVWRVHQTIKKKRNSASVLLTGRLLDTLRRIRGPEATAEYIHGTLKNSSMAISNMIGPMDQMAFAGHPIQGLYYFVAGAPQSLAVLIMSYMGNLRIAIAMEKDFIDARKFTSCMDKAFQMIHKEAISSPIFNKPAT